VERQPPGGAECRPPGRLGAARRSLGGQREKMKLELMKCVGEAGRCGAPRAPVPEGSMGAVEPPGWSRRTHTARLAQIHDEKG